MNNFLSIGLAFSLVLAMATAIAAPSLGTPQHAPDSAAASLAAHTRAMASLERLTPEARALVCAANRAGPGASDAAIEAAFVGYCGYTDLWDEFSPSQRQRVIIVIRGLRAS